MAALWAQYQVGYERHLRPAPDKPDDEELDEAPRWYEEPVAVEGRDEPAPEIDQVEEREAEPGRTAEVTS